MNAKEQPSREDMAPHWIIDPPYPDRRCRCRATKSHDNAGRPVDAEHADPTDPRALLDAYAYEDTSTPEHPMSRRYDTAYPMYAALLAVLHRHRVDDDGNCFECAEASLSFGATPVSYPCATVQDITAELEAS